MNPQLLQAGPSMLPSEGLVDDVIAMDATTVLGSDGEVLPLVEKVRGHFFRKRSFLPEASSPFDKFLFFVVG